MKVDPIKPSMIVVSVRLPQKWMDWIEKNAPRLKMTQSEFLRIAALEKMWDEGYDKNRKEVEW